MLAHPEAARCAEACRRAGPQEAAARRDQCPIVPVPCTYETSHTAALFWLTLPRHECCSFLSAPLVQTPAQHRLQARLQPFGMFYWTVGTMRVRLRPVSI